MKQEELIEKYESLDLEKLPEKLSKNGFEYQMVKRTKSKCLYHNASGGYEVFKNKIIKYREKLKTLRKNSSKEFIEEKYQEYKESFPANEEFGVRAWYYPDLKSAEKRYESLA